MKTTDRLSVYLAENPRSGPQMIFALLAVIVLILAGIMVYSLDIGRYFEPPYPSEDTPLSITEDGVVWTTSFDVHHTATNYTFMRWTWGEIVGGIGWGVTRPLANLANQQVLSSGTQVSVDAVYATITDILGDGEFGTGDQILFRCHDMGSDFPVEGAVYRMALVYIGWDGVNLNLVGWGEYCCAVDDGRFYSWASDELPSGLPWWYMNKWDFDPSPI